MINSRMLQEILNSIKHSVKCPKCNSSYNENDINLLGQIGPNFLLKLDCPKCKFPLMVNVMVQEGEGANDGKIMGMKMEEIDFPEVSNATFSEDNQVQLPEKHPSNKKSISVDDFIDFASKTSSFSGTVQQFLKKI